jgi:hypothetical protein
VGVERGPPSLVSTIEELLGRKSSGSGLESREYGRRDPSSWPRDTLYLQKLALTLPTSGGRSFGIVRLRTKATEFVLFYHPEMSPPDFQLSPRLKSGLKDNGSQAPRKSLQKRREHRHRKVVSGTLLKALRTLTKVSLPKGTTLKELIYKWMYGHSCLCNKSIAGRFQRTNNR